MPNYQLSKIYKIVPLNSEDDADIYIGSTTKNTLAERMSGHRGKYRSWLNDKTNYTSSYQLFEKYGLENCHIYLIESFPCNKKDELSAREGHFITATPCVNKNVAGRSREESSKIYLEKHKTKIHLRRNRQFYCCCGGCFTDAHRGQHKLTSRHINYFTQYNQLMKQIDELLEEIKTLKPIKLLKRNSLQII